MNHTVPIKKETADETIIDKKHYTELIGCLLYVILCTRTDLYFAINYFSRYPTDG